MYKSFFQILRIFLTIDFKLCKNNSQKPSILYGCLDVDRYAIKDGKFFSPILASIHGYLDSDFEVVNVTQSVSKFYSTEILNGHINLNFLLIIDILVKPLFFIIGRRKKKSLKVSVYKKILLKNKVKLVVSIQPSHALCIAAHDLGIKVAEPMHGMNLAVSDKIFLSQFDGVEDYLLPDYFIAFDDQTYQTLNIILKNRKAEVILMPHPWHCECLKTESALIDKSQLVSISNFNSDKVILLSLQWGYDGEREIFNNIIPNGILHDSVIDVIKNHKDIFWLIRLHPIQLKRRFYQRHRKFIADLCEKFENTEFVVASSAPLPLLLKQVNGHLTMSSGSAGEAALMNIPSLMLCPTLREGGAISGSFEHPSIENFISFSEPTSSNIYNWISSLNEFSFSYSDNLVNSRKIREVLDYLEKKN
jgi:hypothetical protein